MKWGEFEKGEQRAINGEQWRSRRAIMEARYGKGRACRGGEAMGSGVGGAWWWRKVMGTGGERRRRWWNRGEVARRARAAALSGGERGGGAGVRAGRRG